MKKGTVVSIVRVEGAIGDAVSKATELIGGLSERIQPGDKVLIKPNFIREEPSVVGTTTNFEIIKRVVELVREAGGHPVVGEASGNQYDTEEIYELLGLREALDGVEVRDLDRDEIVGVTIQGATNLKEVGVARSALEADYIISLPVLKTHMSTGTTLGMKNMMGVLPQREKWKMHMSGLHYALVDLNRLVKPDLVIVDGIVGMEGMGPTIGSPVEMNLILAGEDVVAVDTVGSAVMGFNADEVKHLQLAGQARLGINELKKINIKGENLAAVSRRFKRPFGGKAILLWAQLQYRLGTFLLSRYDYDIRPFLKKVSDLYVAKPRINPERCVSCGQCVAICPRRALELRDHARIDYAKCDRCFLCMGTCPQKVFTMSRKPAWWLRLSSR
jgi:uncharacterized protein (DUF362 family)/ferredoxin